MGTTAQKLQAILDSKADIAAAITEKGGSVPTKFADYGDAIRNIQTTAEVPDIEFIDYDGRTLSTYSFEEASALTELPEIPAHEGLSAQGWNYSLADVTGNAVNGYKTTIGPTYVGVISEVKHKIYRRCVAAGIWDQVDTWLQNSAPSIVKADWNQSPLTLTTETKAALKGQFSELSDEDLTDDILPATKITISGVSGKSFSTKVGQASAQSMYMSWGDGEYVGTITGNVGSTNASVRTHTYPATADVYTITIWQTTAYAGRNTINLTEPFCNYIFSDCEKIVKVELGGVNKIQKAFAGCTNVSAINIPTDTLNTSSTSAFIGMTSLNGAVIPSGVSTVPPFAFSGCTSLKKVSVPNTTSALATTRVTNTHHRVFFNCKALPYICIPYVTDIGSNSFENCASLEHIYGDHISKIDWDTFKNCGKLETINLSAVDYYGAGCFLNCISLKDLGVTSGSPSVTAIGDRDNSTPVFDYCLSLEKVPEFHVSVVPQMAFRGCKNLKSVKITFDAGAGIGKQAFTESGITTFDFSDSTSIPTLSGTNAFQFIDEVSTTTSSGAGITIKVPAALATDWKAAANWSAYADRIVGV